jgi:hypothetical protein
MLFDNKGFVDTASDDMTPDASSYIMEAVMMDTLSSDELSAFLESSSEIGAAVSDNVLLERTIVRLDKHAKLSKARKMAVFTVAKEKNDPKFKKLLKVWKMERYLEAELDKKYGNEAMRRAKKTIANAGKSKSNTMKKVASKAKAMFNAPTAKPKKVEKPEFISLK